MQVESMNLQQAVEALRKLPKLCDSIDERDTISGYREALIAQIERWTQDKEYIAKRNSFIPKAQALASAYGNGSIYMREFLQAMDGFCGTAPRRSR